MSDDNPTIVGKYTRRLEVVAGIEHKADPKAYHAYGIDIKNNKTPRIRIEYNNADRMIDSPTKSYLTEVRYSSGRYLALIFTGSAFLLEGEHLDELSQHLDADQIKSLHVFNPKLHDKPAEGEPIITRIRRMGAEIMPEWEEA